jgi:hypothetical protein
MPFADVIRTPVAFGPFVAFRLVRTLLLRRVSALCGIGTGCGAVAGTCAGACAWTTGMARRVAKARLNIVLDIFMFYLLKDCDRKNSRRQTDCRIASAFNFICTDPMQ